MKKIFSSWHLIFFLLLCQTIWSVANADLTQEQMISERTIQRWTALIGQNFDRAYEFETPGFRQAIPSGRYRNFYGSAVRWKNVKVERIDLLDDQKRAKVIILLDYEAPNAGGEGIYQGQSSIEEIWLWIDNNWWYVRHI